MCSFLWKGHKNSLVETLQSLLKSDTLLDCTIAAGGQYLRAHKVILAASSPYFKLLFTQEHEKNPIVVLKDVNFQELECIIEYIYKGEVEVPAGQVKSFLRTAESLQIVGLRGSTQERVDGEDNDSSIATGASPIARKRRKHNHHDTNSGGNSQTGAHFSVTDETSEISPFVAISNLSENCSVPNFLLRENSVQDNSEIPECVQNFVVASSEILGENTVETKLEHDNLPIAPLVSRELISNNHVGLRASNLCDNSIHPSVCDNITNQAAGQKECVINSHSMEQQHVVFIKQDPDTVDISEEHFQDGTGYGGGDFLGCNSTVDPPCDAVDAPNMRVLDTNSEFTWRIAKKGGRRRDPIWAKYEEIEENGSKKAKCKKCGHVQSLKACRMRAHVKSCEQRIRSSMNNFAYGTDNQVGLNQVEVG